MLRKKKNFMLRQPVQVGVNMISPEDDNFIKSEVNSTINFEANFTNVFTNKYENSYLIIIFFLGITKLRC